MCTGYMVRVGSIEPAGFLIHASREDTWDHRAEIIVKAVVPCRPWVG